METQFGRDFGDVRIHTDAEAAQSARSLGALAYTVGRDVVFGAGQYEPDAPIGRYLLAHELIHVAQQHPFSRSHDLVLDQRGSPFEQEARRGAADVVAGRPLSVSSAGPASSGLVMLHSADLTTCPAPPLWTIIGARDRSVYEPANDAIEKAYANDPRHKGHAVLTGSQFEYGGNKEIRLPRGAPDRRAGDAILSRLRGLVRQRAPDIVNFTERVFYEIKTPDYALDGMGQLATLYGLTEAIRLELGADGGPPWDPGFATWYPPHVLPFPGNPKRLVCTQMTDYTVTTPGLILYVVLERRDEEEKKKKKAQAVAKPEEETETQKQEGSVPTAVAIGAGGAVLTATAAALLRKRAKEEAARRAAQALWRRRAEAAAAKRAAQGAGKRLGGKAAGKAAAYVEIAAAAALIVFYSERVEARPGPGASPIEALYRAMTTSGTPPSPELKKLIESDPLLMQLAEEATTSGDPTALQQEMTVRILTLIRDNPDVFSPEDLDFLMEYSKTAKAAGQTPQTVDELRKAIDAAKAGKTGKGTGKGKGKDRPAEAGPAIEPEGKAGKESATGGAGKLSAEARKRIDAAPGPVRDLFKAVVASAPEGGAVDDKFVDAYLALLSSADPPLTPADVVKLRERLVPAKGTLTPAQALDELKKALASRQAKSGAEKGAAGTGEDETESGKKAAKAGKPGAGAGEGEMKSGKKAPKGGREPGVGAAGGKKKRAGEPRETGTGKGKAGGGGSRKGGGGVAFVPVTVRKGEPEGEKLEDPRRRGVQLVAGLRSSDQIPAEGLERDVTVNVLVGQSRYTVTVTALFTERTETARAITYKGTLKDTYTLYPAGAGADAPPLLTLPEGDEIELPFLKKK